MYVAKFPEDETQEGEKLTKTHWKEVGTAHQYQHKEGGESFTLFLKRGALPPEQERIFLFPIERSSSAQRRKEEG